MEPWLIALDLDGTLLKKDHTIGEATKSALQQAMSLGHIVTIATGRPPRAAVAAYQALQLTTPLIALNGAYIKFSNQPGDISVTTLSQDVIEAISQEAIAMGSRGMLGEIGDHCVIRHSDRPMWMDEEHEHFFYQAVVAETPENPAIYLTLSEAWPNNAYSLLIQLPKRQHPQFYRWIHTHWPDQIYTRSWRDPFDVVEIIPIGVSKATGLRKIQQHYGISPLRIMAFGDEMNDLEMFNYASISVAMGNANPALLPHATYITDDCENEGIAAYLNTHFFTQHFRVT
jgi:Cof subfamily protein (haloacid dehalogenase superfamily)